MINKDLLYKVFREIRYQEVLAVLFGLFGGFIYILITQQSPQKKGIILLLSIFYSLGLGIMFNSSLCPITSEIYTDTSTNKQLIDK